MSNSTFGVQTFDVVQIEDNRGEWSDYVTIQPSDVMYAIGMVRTYSHYRIVGKGLRSNFRVTHAMLAGR